MLGQAREIRRSLRRRWARPSALCSAALFCALSVGSDEALAVNKESPEVKKLVDKGLEFLSQSKDDRLGAKCLIALAFLKAEQRDSPKIQEAIYACRETIQSNTDNASLDVYSNGLAPIFLCE